MKGRHEKNLRIDKDLPFLRPSTPLGALKSRHRNWLELSCPPQHNPAIPTCSLYTPLNWSFRWRPNPPMFPSRDIVRQRRPWALNVGYLDKFSMFCSFYAHGRRPNIFTFLAGETQIYALLYSMIFDTIVDCFRSFIIPLVRPVEWKIETNTFTWPRHVRTKEKTWKNVNLI